ncbi:MAG: shikimate dehydrogenase [Acholeplasmatales bacterium]|nr:shikimate dehydrogenase [Acholeplasmatales bacterium]
MKKYALLGEKLSHSYSPIIHKKIFEAYNIDADYSLLECNKNDLEGIINKLRTGEYSGFNVTIPYKIEVMKYLDEISDEAKAIGSCNTIAYKDGKIIGYNTDYFGFYNELVYYNVEVKNKDCYILGTGGASLALYKALIDMGGNVKYVSRNPKNSETITYLELENKNIDLLVNATPVGMSPNVGFSPVKSDIAKRSKYVVDIIFNPKRTQLLLDANSNMNGLLMLVGQAVKAEEIWQDKKYPLDIIGLLKEIEAMI